MAFVRARKAFFTTGRRLIAEGRVLDSSDPLVVAHPLLFVPVVADPLPGGVTRVEQASAAPGEVRDVAVPVKKAAPRKRAAAKK